MTITGTTTLSNTAALDASWTPRYSALTAYWNFDGRAPLPHNSNIAAVVGPSIRVQNPDGWDVNYVDGQVGQAVSVNGAGYGGGYLSSNGNLTAGSAFTVAFWTLSVAKRDNCSFSVALSNSSDASDFIAFGYDGGGCGEPNFIYCTSGGASCGSINAFPYTYDTWQHQALTHDGNTLSFYVDGQLQSATAASVTFPFTDTLGIGKDSATGNRNFALFLDELAIWSEALDANEISQIYGRQAASFSGSITSQVYVSPTMPGADMALMWSSTLPTNKGLPSGSVSETPSDYSGMTTSVLNSNLVGVWHFDEAALQTVPGGDFLDDSRSGNTAFAWQYGGSFATPGVPGLIGKAVSLAGTNSGITSTTSFVSPNTFSIGVWFKAVSGGGRLLGFSDAQAAGQSSYDRHLYLGTDGLVYFGVYPNQAYYLTSTRSYADNKWHHALASLSGAGMALYVDGVLVASNPAVTAGEQLTGFWTLGNAASQWPNAGGYFSGRLDEAAVWTRALDANEVQVLYRRGANRLKLQVRGCLSSTCSDAPPWQGYDGLATSYLTEVQNVSNGNTLNAAPVLPLSRVAPAISLNPNVYLQYRAVLESDDASFGCIYNSQRTACSPEIKSIALARMNYDTSSPTIGNANFATPYYDLQSFAQMVGAAGCAAGLRYRLSPDGTHYYYYNGATWAVSNNSSAQSNLASDLNANAMQAFSNQFPFGKTYFQAVLASDGLTPCAASFIGIQGTQ